MKKTKFYSTALCALLLSATQSCIFEHKANQPQQQPVADTATINLTFKDSVGKSQIASVFSGVLPTVKNAPLYKSVHEWINDYSGGEFAIKDSLDMKPTLEYYQRTWIKSSKEQLQQMEQVDYVTDYSLDCTFNVKAQTDKYLSLAMSTYRYEGGAHGSTVICQQTFRKSDGRLLGWGNIIKPESMYDFQEVLKKYVMKYLNVTTEEELKENLLNPDLVYGMLQPQTPPILTTEGLYFVFQQYEICAYAIGMPDGIIPYEEIKDMLTTSALGLLDLPEFAGTPIADKE